MKKDRRDTGLMILAGTVFILALLWTVSEFGEEGFISDIIGLAVIIGLALLFAWIRRF